MTSELFAQISEELSTSARAVPTYEWNPFLRISQILNEVGLLDKATFIRKESSHGFIFFMLGIVELFLDFLINKVFHIAQAQA